jgi:hypothetical protein
MSTKVTSPQKGDTVHSTFTASGSTDATAISGTMVYKTNPAVQGTGHVGGKSFSVSFSGLTPEPDDGWTLNIYENSTATGTPAVTVENLTVIH